MSKIIGSTLYAPAGKAFTVSASLTSKSGVTYTDGKSGGKMTGKLKITATPT